MNLSPVCSLFSLLVLHCDLVCLLFFSEEAVIVSRLKEAGAIIFAKVNLTEMGIHVSGIPSVFLTHLAINIHQFDCEQDSTRIKDMATAEIHTIQITKLVAHPLAADLLW